jgi:CBS domain-containing protein
VAIVKEHEPITGEQIADFLSVTRAAIRSDLAVLTMSRILDAKPRVGYFFTGRHADYFLGQRFREMKVGDVKSVPTVIRDESSVYDALVMLFLEDIGTLFVVDTNGNLAGVVSRKDLLKATMGQGDIHRMPVGVIMTRMPNIVYVTSDESVLDAARKIVTREVDALPVVRQRDAVDPKTGHSELEVVGRFTKTTIARLLVEMAEGRREE